MTTEKVTRARCSIYEHKPVQCTEYPKIDQYMPEECTYYFVGNERRGECNCGVGACCAISRDRGEPTGSYLPEIAGGLPCKHLVMAEEDAPAEKTAAVESGSAPPMEDDIMKLVGGPDDS
jgi:hypothetical protein